MPSNNCVLWKYSFRCRKFHAFFYTKKCMNKQITVEKLLAIIHCKKTDRPPADKLAACSFVILCCEKIQENVYEIVLNVILLSR